MSDGMTDNRSQRSKEVSVDQSAITVHLHADHVELTAELARTVARRLNQAADNADAYVVRQMEEAQQRKRNQLMILRSQVIALEKELGITS